MNNSSYNKGDIFFLWLFVNTLQAFLKKVFWMLASWHIRPYKRWRTDIRRWRKKRLPSLFTLPRLSHLRGLEKIRNMQRRTKHLEQISAWSLPCINESVRLINQRILWMRVLKKMLQKIIYSQRAMFDIGTRTVQVAKYWGQFWVWLSSCQPSFSKPISFNCSECREWSTSLPLHCANS